MSNQNQTTEPELCECGVPAAVRVEALPDVRFTVCSLKDNKMIHQETVGLTTAYRFYCEKCYNKNIKGAFAEDSFGLINPELA